MVNKIFMLEFMGYDVYITWESRARWALKKEKIINKAGEVPDYISIFQPYYYHIYFGHIWIRWVKPVTGL